MDKARVSVVITTYNRKKLLKKSIKSVLNQSLPDFELIVVDDCSDEPLENYVKSFGDPRVRYFRTSENSGHDGLPKNIGIKNAVGEWVCFLDDDDAYRADALKVLATYANQSQADVVYGDYLIDGKPGWSVDFNVSRLSQHNYIAMPVVMVRRETLLKVGGFDQDVPKFKDWNLWLRIQKFGGRFLHVPIIVAEVSQQKDSISTKFDVEADEMGNYTPTFFNPADCTIYPSNTILGEKKPLRVAVYTLTMDRFEYTKKMYKALEKSAGYAFDWFVIDQGSTDGTQDWLKSLTRDKQANDESWRANLKYRLYKNNVGLAKGWNNIVEFIKSEGQYDIIVKVDNDAELLTDGWLKAMVNIYERNRRLILSPYVEGLEGSPGGVLRQRASGDSPYMLINDTVLGLVPNLGGIVFATPIELFDKWTFDEAYQGNKDLILSQYAQKNGYSCFYMEEYRVWHIEGTRGQHARYPEYFKGRPDVPTKNEDSLPAEQQSKPKRGLPSVEEVERHEEARRDDIIGAND